MAQLIGFFFFFLSIICSISCRSYSHGNINMSIAQSYLNMLPTDGLKFFQKFSEGLKLSGDDSECAQQVRALVAKPDQAIQMFDAWSKIPSGLLYSSGVDYGNFDECVAIDFNKDTQIRVMGKHCSYALIIPYTADLNKILDESFKLSVCIPDKCNKTHIMQALNLNIDLSQFFSDDFCVSKEDKWENLDIITGVIVLILVFLMTISTIYDIFLYYFEIDPVHPLFLAFSVYTNGKKLFQVTSNKGAQEQILVFHGLKFISMSWIIAGHNGVVFESFPLDNYKGYGQSWLREYYTAYLQTGHLAVDTFFFISGFLMAYLYFKTEAHKPTLKQIINVPLGILHRYLRLTPALLVVYLFFTYVLDHFEWGPLTHITENIKNPCKNHWAAIFLYIQNYNNRKELCMTQLWYVSADMQLYVFSFLFLIPLAIQYNRKQFKAVMIELGILCVFAAFLPVYTKLQFRDYDPAFDEYDTHSRIVDYVMGITLGVFIRRGSYNHNKISPVINVILWILSLTLMFVCVVLNEAGFLSDIYVDKTIYFSLMRPLWCLGLSYVIWSCYHGRGGIINWFLSCGFMQVGSKLTYAIYLTHGSLIGYWMFSLRTPMHLSDFQLFYSWCGALILSLIVSTFLSLACESPMITIEKFIFRRGGPPKKPVQAHTAQN